MVEYNGKLTLKTNPSTTLHVLLLRLSVRRTGRASTDLSSDWSLCQGIRDNDHINPRDAGRKRNLTRKIPNKLFLLT